MSLHLLLQECGGDDDGAGSDMDVCIENDGPPAPPASSSSPPLAGSTSSSLGSSMPQEYQAQGAGDDPDQPVDVAFQAQGAGEDPDQPVDVALDSSPHSPSADVADGDGARPLCEAAEAHPALQERETPQTPTSAAGGAGGEGPEATPTAGSPEYSADAMAARLASIPLEGQSIEGVEAAVVGAFLEFGVEMKRCDSKKSSKEPGARLRLIGLACKHAMKNRQKEYREGDGANSGKRRKSNSRRTNCAVKGYIRWPVNVGNKHPDPILSFKELNHNHPVNKGVVDEVRRQTKPLDTPTKDACVKLTGKYAGFKPAVQGKMIQALTGERPNARAIQDRRLLYVDMVKRTNAAVSAGVELVPPDTLRAIVETFESSLNAAARISSGQGVVLGNPQAVRQPAKRSQGARAKSSLEYGGARARRRAQAPT
ncbi:unnamed protein product [Ectocarpus sp. CCAP 1310/34]|nr:unnamed protein product [Ectocarpus sp. CCAP 1310/34]